MRLYEIKVITAMIANKRFLGVLCLSLATSCATGKPADMHYAITNSTESGQEQGYEAINGEVAENVNPRWHAHSIRTPARFSQVHFINEQVGWAYGKNAIYRTDDSGTTWKTLPSGFVKGTEIDALHFINELNGWIVLKYYEKGYTREEKDHVKVYLTADGGRTWELSYSENAFFLNEAFFSDGDLWLTGWRILKNRYEDGSTLLYYSGESKTWFDISRPILEINRSPWFPESHSPSIAGIAVTSEKCWVAANRVEMIFRTCDKGMTWNHITSIGIRTDPIHGPAVLDIGILDDFIWTFQTMKAIDQGIATVVTIIPDDRNKSKKMLWLNGYHSKEVLVLSDQEIFVVSEKASLLLKDDYSSDSGLVLHTVDGGNTWEKIFRSSDKIEFAQFLQSSQLIVWIITEKGDLYKLTRSAV